MNDLEKWNHYTYDIYSRTVEMSSKLEQQEISFPCENFLFQVKISASDGGSIELFKSLQEFKFL